jgi:hypothetical protein
MLIYWVTVAPCDDQTCILFPHSFIRTIMAFRLALLLSLLLCVTATSPAKAETWTNLEGTKSIDAELIGLWGNQVLLKLDGGKRLSISMDGLRSDSRIQATNLAASLEKSRSERSQDLKKAAGAAAAPAPDPLPRLPAAPAYSPPPVNVACDVFLDSVHQSQVDGHLLVLIDALPPKARDEVSLAAAEIVKTIGVENVAALAKSLQGAGASVVDKQSWLARSPRFSDESSDKQEFMTEILIPLAGLLKEALKPEVFDADALAKGELRAVIEKIDPVAAPYLRQLVNEFELAPPAFLITEKEKEATLTEVVGESKAVQTLVNVDGYWVPKANAESMNETLTSVKSRFAAMALPSLNILVSATFGPMAEADTEEKYHQAVEGVIEPIALLEKLLAGWAGATTPNSGEYGDSGYPEGYGEESGEGDSQRMNEAMQRGMSGPPGN